MDMEITEKTVSHGVHGEHGVKSVHCVILYFASWMKE